MKNRKQNQKSILRFSPAAWSKLLFMRDMTDNEVGGFAVTPADDLLFVADFVLVKQKVTSISVAFDDEAVADYFEDQVQAGRKPEQFGRIWVHTHPDISPEPSGKDEQTFARVFGSCQWAIMAIIARDGKSYAQLQFNVGPTGSMLIPINVDYRREFSAVNFNSWQQLYADKVKTDSPHHCIRAAGRFCYDPQDVLEELEMMAPEERQVFMDELALRSEFWEESEVTDE